MNVWKRTTIGATALLGILTLTVVAAPAMAQNTGSRMQQGMQQGMITSAGKKFMKMAAMGGMFEISSSQLALKKSNRDDVKQFAQMMVSAHSQVNGQLKQLARSKGVGLPNMLDRAHQKKYNQLARLNGAAFDNAYLKAQHQAHVAAVDVFSNGSVAPRDSDVKRFAERTLPDIREHLNMVQGLRDGRAMNMAGSRTDRMSNSGSTTPTTPTTQTNKTP